MNNLTLTEVFCARLLHDLLSPIGALQLAVDSWKHMPNEACASLIENSMDSVVNSLDLLRKTYAYAAINMETKHLEELTKTNFGNKIRYHTDIPVYWRGHLLRLLVWLRYKLLENSKVEIQCNADQMEVNITGIYLNDDEIELIKTKQGEANSYLIYLIMLLQHLTNHVSLEVIGDKPNFILRFTKLSF